MAVVVRVREPRTENGPFELDVEHVLGRKAHGKMLELRGIGWDDKRHSSSDVRTVESRDGLILLLGTSS